MKSKILLILASLIIVLFSYPVGYYVLTNTQKIIDSKIFQPEKVNAYVINLDSSKARHDYITPLIEALGLKTARISAIDGRKLSDIEIRQLIDPNIFDFYWSTKGTIGCSLSHIKTWKEFLDSDAEFALILEDDINFEPAKLRSVIDELTHNQSYWDIVSFDVAHKGTPVTIKTLGRHQHLSLYLTEVTHTGSYLLNRKAALKLLEKSLPIKMPVDHYFNRPWEFGLVFTGVENPRLVSQQRGYSDIKHRELIEHQNHGIIFKLNKMLYKMQSYTARFFYNIAIFATYVNQR